MFIYLHTRESSDRKSSVIQYSTLIAAKWLGMNPRYTILSNNVTIVAWTKMRWYEKAGKIGLGDKF